MSGSCRRLLIRCLLVYLLGLANADSQTDDVIKEGNEIIEDFYHRYNTTKEIDLVFVLDRSGSVPLEGGWSSMINFVKDILEHFTVDKDNTRVAIVTYSTSASVDIDDLEPGTYSDGENKCTLNRRIDDYIQRKIPYGYTATYHALNSTYQILLNSRPSAKKAVFVLTDGKSNIGPPPVKVAFDIRSLQWDESWNETFLGPQVEIYAFGIEHAEMAELQSMASNLPNHVFLIPNFQLFENLARSLHGDRQEERWIPAQTTFCDDCRGSHSHCMCGTKIGQYACVCSPGYQMSGVINMCKPCSKGFYKSTFSPDACTKCPVNMTTEHEASTGLSECRLLPGLRECPTLPDIPHGRKFRVAGVDRNEVLNTGVPCDPVTDGNSCHYECEEGYRLTGTPVMICNASGLWEGSVPNCSIVDCHQAGTTTIDIPNAQVNYVNDTTTYNSHLNITCNPGLVAFGNTYWQCNKYGHWTQPSNFECVALFCDPLKLRTFVTPADSSTSCISSPSPVDRTCALTCPSGFRLEGPDKVTCNFDGQPTWYPEPMTRCVDTQDPTITCPSDLNRDLASWDSDFIIIRHQNQEPTITDNSNIFNYTVEGAPEDDKFRAGHNPLRYVAMDAAGNTAFCDRWIIVEEKNVVVDYCPPAHITAVANTADGDVYVTWPEPVFLGPGNISVPITCSMRNGTKFRTGEYTVSCEALEQSTAKCMFVINVTEPECANPFPERAPANGALICTREHLTFPKVCRVHCDPGYEFWSKETFHCDWDGTWSPEVSLPNCQYTYRDKIAKINRNGVVVRYEGSCSEDSTEIREGFRQAISAIFGPHPTCETYICDLEDIDIVCGQSRRKRFVNSRATRDATVQNITIYFSITGQIDADDNAIDEEDQQELYSALLFLYGGVRRTLLPGNYLFNISGQEYPLVDYIASNEGDLVQFFGNCSEGQIRDSQGAFPRCMTCGPGSYLFNATACLECPIGTYQDEESQSSCKPCPEGTNNTLPGAWNASECREPCQPGFYSRSGYEPCKPCPAGTYQSSSMSVECVACPNETSTAGEGCSDVAKCVSPCVIGTYSTTGLEPCKGCPLGTTTLTIGSDECISCSKQGISDYCPETVDCPSVLTCVNGGCVSFQTTDPPTVVCQCSLGYSGDSCEDDVDECLEVECLNNGTCQQAIVSFQCLCESGYAGKLCEKEVNECDSTPCQNTGYCQDLFDGYKCYCPSGFTGTNCEVDIDDCVNNTCDHGSCKDLRDGYECICEPGYEGEYCELMLDYCANVTCGNGGQCVNAQTTFQCRCKDGFIGMYCEDKEDNCLSQPCQNNATCFSKSSGFFCKCLPGFSGQRCQKEVSEEFVLMFPDSPSTSYVKIEEVPELSAFTVCLWLRTMDSSKYGTILSYAVESNWLAADYSSALTLYDYGRLQVIVNGHQGATNISLNDGWWQHLCVTWKADAGEWSVMVNGSHVAGGIGLADGTRLEGGGILVLGQEQDTVGGGFNARESFIGEMSQLNMFDSVLSEADIAELADSSSVCRAGAGNVVAWTDALDGFNGNVQHQTTFPCLDPNQCYQGTLDCPVDYQCVNEEGVFQCKPCLPGDSACGGINTCAAKPCRNGGRCIDGQELGDFRCVCKEDFTGNLCEIPLEGCISDLCQNGGTCMHMGISIRCVCPPGYAGHYCESEYTGGCGSDPCLNGATCTPDGDFYSCHCQPEYTGMRCESLLDPCAKKPCQHNGTCTHDVSRPGFSCDCRPPYKGKYCHIRHKPSCSQSPCLNGGTCSVAKETAAGYECSCPTSSTERYGPNCEILTACESEPCLNGGTCAARPDEQYECLCSDWFTGVNCETAVSTTEAQSTVAETTTEKYDFCSNINCEHGGTCQAGDDTAPCKCTVDYTGEYCEKTREKETRNYAVTLTLSMQYRKSLRHDPAFIRRFREQVFSLYKPATRDSKLRVKITDVKPGSTIVSFGMDHVVYPDSKLPIYDSEHMKNLLEDSLKKGKLGNLHAVMDDNFKFNEIEPDQKSVTGSNSPAAWVYVLIVLVVILVIAAILIGLFVCRKRRSRPVQKQNNIPETYHNQVNNPTFDSTSFEAPQVKNITEEDIYAEPGDFPKPYAVTYAKGGRFPSKAGKDINKEWAVRQSIPLPLTPAEEKTIAVARMSQNLKPTDPDNEYLAPCRGTPPPSYKDLMGHCSKASSLASIPECAPPDPPPERKPINSDPVPDPVEDSVYFTPISEEEKAQLVKGAEAKKDEPGNSNHGYRSRSNSDSVESLVLEDNESPTSKSGQYLPMTKGTEGSEAEPADGGYVPPTPLSADGEPEYAIRGPLTSLS